MQSSGRKNYEKLKKDFPDQKEKIDKYIKYVNTTNKYMGLYVACEILPKWLAGLMKAVYHKFFRNWSTVTTDQVMKELGITGRLYNNLTILWGYYASHPSTASWLLHCITIVHYYHGTYYPIGGAKVIA